MRYEEDRVASIMSCEWHPYLYLCTLLCTYGATQLFTWDSEWGRVAGMMSCEWGRVGMR